MIAEIDIHNNEYRVCCRGRRASRQAWHIIYIAQNLREKSTHWTPETALVEAERLYRLEKSKRGGYPDPESPQGRFL